MARPSDTSTFQPIDDPAQPSLADARLAAINQVVAPDTQPPAPEHPAVTYARNLLSPMGPFGQGGAPRSLAGAPSTPQPAPVDFSGIGNALGGLGNSLASPEYGLGATLGAAYRGTAEVLSGGHFEGNTLVPSDVPLPGYGAAGALAEGAAAPLARLAANRVLGGAAEAARPAQAAAALEPQTNLERMIASGQDFTKVPKDVAAADEAAGKAGQVSPSGDVAVAPTPRYVVETGKTRSFVKDATTGEDVPGTLAMGPGHAERAAAKAEQLNTPTPAAGIEVPMDAALTGALRYVTRAKANPVGDTVGDVVRRAARSSPEVVTPDFLAAQPEVRAHLDQALLTAKVPATDANASALASRLLEQEQARPSVGNLNAQKVREALGAPPEAPPPIDFGPEPSAGGGEPPQGPPLVGTSPNESPIPFGPVGRNPAKAVALGMLDLVTDVPRAAYLAGHLPLFRQGLPMMADAFLRGNPAEIPLAVGRTLRSYVLSDARNAAITDQFRGVLADAGFTGDGLRKLVSDIHGPLSAREDYTLNSILQNFPVLKQLNRGFPTMMNSLRVGMALDRVEMAKAAGQKVDYNLIADQVAHLSGKGDLPGVAGGTFQTIMSRALFGPKLLTAPWQVAVDTIKSLGSIGSDALGRRPLKANDIAQVRAVAAYVLSGATFMQMMQRAGWQVDTNADSRDWGRAIDPDTGERVDLWGAFGPDARLVMQTITRLNETQVGIGTPVRPQKYGQSDVLDMIQDYLRNKLGPGLPAVAANVLTGKTGGGQPFSLHDELAKAGQDPLGYAAANAPRPLAVESFQGSNPATATRNALLTEAGAGVVTTPYRQTYDGLGTAEGQPNYRTGSILDTYAKMVEASKGSGTPWHGGDPIMPAPPSTIGSGRSELKLDAKTAGRFAQAVGGERDRALGPLVNSPEFQNAGATRQQQMFDEARQKADNTATRVFMRDEVITATDPKAVAAEAVSGFVAQGASLHDRAYWVATLDRAGKLTPEAAQAIDTYEQGLASAEKRAPITVEEYRRNAPLAHEYLSHVPFGTDAHPIGTPADWTAVAQAHVAKNDRVEELVRSGVNPSLADARAQAEIVKSMTSLVQRNLFLNGALLENPQRTLLSRKYPLLDRFLGSAHKYTRESEAAYQSFP